VTRSQIAVRTIWSRDEFVDHDALMQDVWGMSSPLVSLEMLTAIAHSGGYVAAAFAGGRMVGASVGFLADHHGERALHSHVTAVVEFDATRRDRTGDQAAPARLGRRARTRLDHVDVRSVGASQRLVQHRDPRRRRRRIPSVVLRNDDRRDQRRRRVRPAPDGLGRGRADSRPSARRQRRGRPLFVPTPTDIVELRRTDPSAVRTWRTETREALTTALDAGRRVLGFTRDGSYVIGSSP
jgi:predicted GNAT superfamily acetyltransferase